MTDANPLADYREKSPAAGRMGKAAELLVASACMLSSRGELNAATSLVDDEGVDLVFNRRGSSATLAVQVKARTSESKRAVSGRFVAFVRTQTLRERGDLDLLFVMVDANEARLLAAWLVPSSEFVARAGQQNARGRLRFAASMKPAAQDRWSAYRLTPAELAPRVLERLAELNEGTV